MVYSAYPSGYAPYTERWHQLKMKEEISIKQTKFFRYWLTPILILLTILFFLVFQEFKETYFTQTQNKIIFGLFFIYWNWTIYKTMSRVNRVFLTNTGIILNDFRYEVEIPFDQIEYVSQYHNFMFHIIVIEYRNQQDEFKKGRFIGKFEVAYKKDFHPIVTRLREKIKTNANNT